MPGGRLSALARAMREDAKRDTGTRPAGARRDGAGPDGAGYAGATPSPGEPGLGGRGTVSRRGLLRIGGAAGVSAALAACTARSSPAAGRAGSAAAVAGGVRVAVVGAGLAGTTAAYRLAHSGVQVRLFEARDRIGGRCWTARGFADGQTAEHGGEFIDTRHVHLRGLAAELGLQLDDLWKGDVAGAVSPSWIDGGYFHYSKVNAQLDRITTAVKAAAQRIGVTNAHGRSSDVAYSYGTVTAGARQMDELNMREWLDQHVPGVSGDVKTFLDQAMSGWYGLDMAGLSALNWIDYLIIPYPGGDERWHVRHGNDQVPILAAKALPAGATQLESPLQALIKRADGSYELRFGGSAPSRPVIADHVILTIPWTTLREVDLEGAGFSSYRMTAIRELGMGTDVKLIVQYDRRPATFKVHGGPWSGTVNYANPNYTTWDSAPTEPGTAGLITVYAGGSGSKPFASPGYHAPAPADLTAMILGQINQVVPGTRARFNGKAWLDYWTGDPWTRGSYAAYTPGQVTKYWGYAGIPEGRVHFAGEHTSTYSQGFLNGGVESGQRAAIEVLLALGLPVPPA
ncbi:MAG TPA: NAD(P)/FAD-dependent oxidoreductase, partial [Streptosporangiaceae bacterium]